MQFSLRSVKQCGCRVGTLSFQRTAKDENNGEVETPMCMLYTKKGSAPWLSIDMLKRIEKLPPIAHMHLSSLSDHCEAVEKFQQGISMFTAMKDFLSYISVHDTGVEIPSGYNTKAGTAVWNKAGKKLIDPQQFIKCQEAFHPAFYQALSDSDTDKKSGNKRAKKAVDRTLNFLDTILELHKKSERLREVGIFGCIEGGFCEGERKRSARETASRDVDGFVIEGFYAQSEKNDNFNVEEIKDICKLVFENLPEEKPRLMHAVWSPDQVVMAMELGIDIFDSCYPWSVTDRGEALIFSFNYQKNPENEKEAGSSEGYKISLKDKSMFEDFQAPLPGCSCYTCQNFSRSYIHHLLNTSELLAPVLLMIHNFHHYFEFFHALRTSLQRDQFQELKTLILEQRPH
ncbi:queuine tRNA-ribosyltransferase accessory subunit 2-like [Saccostrea echinata]|uniref:queuine tRNA-ribosyltransferase accessory subunit 2-like n=1 Tax=Saccostrea echinata TaxID=191078 RepID=UPI002A81FF2E|nr:queuine tRNA-ribosyltransferase accessory subunit 2-like [Saccostrea echinata]